MAGSSLAVIRETRRGQAVFKAGWPEEPPGGSQSVRSSDEAGNDRGAKGLKESGCAMKPNDDSKSASVAATPKQVEDTRAPWGWVERTVWTERMLTRLTSGELADRVWFSLRDKT
jgi:hypothetical protein